MLQHEAQEETREEATAQPAAQRRVTPEELNAALKALDADRQKAAQLQAGTVAIGEITQELGLDATPDEIWAQVEKQRKADAEKAAAGTPPGALHQAAQAARTATVQAVAAVTTPAATRRRVRGWREIKGWLWVAFWCCGGLGLVTGVLHPSHGIHVSGDKAISTYTVHHEDASVDGDYNTLTLRGSVEAVTVDDDGNTIHWSKDPAGSTTRLEDSGDGNHVGMNAPAP